MKLTTSLHFLKDKKFELSNWWYSSTLCGATGCQCAGGTPWLNFLPLNHIFLITVPSVLSLHSQERDNTQTCKMEDVKKCSGEKNFVEGKRRMEEVILQGWLGKVCLWQGGMWALTWRTKGESKRSGNHRSRSMFMTSFVTCSRSREMVREPAGERAWVTVAATKPGHGESPGQGGAQEKVLSLTFWRHHSEYLGNSRRQVMKWR